MVTLLIFASAEIFPAVLSVYGVLSQRVHERSREIGICMGIGANVARVTCEAARQPSTRTPRQNREVLRR